MSTTNSHTPETSESGYEKRDVNLRFAFGAGAVIVLVIAIFVVILNDVFVLDKEEMMYNAALKPESATLRDQRAREIETLTTYKLVDAGKGVYRVPIKRAMELMAQEAYVSPTEPKTAKR
jgi:hypothetical protein